MEKNIERLPSNLISMVKNVENSYDCLSAFHIFFYQIISQFITCTMIAS